MLDCDTAKAIQVELIVALPPDARAALLRGLTRYPPLRVERATWAGWCFEHGRVDRHEQVTVTVWSRV